MRLKAGLSNAVHCWMRGALATLALWGFVTSSGAGVVADQVAASGTLRVCIWPGYYGVSYRNPNTQQLEGIDIDLSAVTPRRILRTRSRSSFLLDCIPAVTASAALSRLLILVLSGG